MLRRAGVPKWIRIARRIGSARRIARDPSWAEGSVIGNSALAGARAVLWREGRELRELVSPCTSTGEVVWSCRSQRGGEWESKWKWRESICHKGRWIC